MGIVLNIVIAYVTFGIPIAVMFQRSGSSWAYSLFVLIPFIGIPIALLILINRPWQRQRTA